MKEQISIQDRELAEEAKEALARYLARTGWKKFHLKAALIDMDGVLYDSMKYHTLAWVKMMTEMGVPCTREEFYAYEGMTGTATIALLLKRAFGKVLSDEELREKYKIKTNYFKLDGKKELMPGADRMLKSLMDADIDRVLVTGSAQSTLLGSLDGDYPGAFTPEKRVTALDVKHGKPDPEPYLKGQLKAGAKPWECMVIENAPLGVQSGVASGSFTVAVTTGPIEREKFVEAGADMIFDSMPEFADVLPQLIDILKNNR